MLHALSDSNLDLLQLAPTNDGCRYRLADSLATQQPQQFVESRSGHTIQRDDGIA